MHILFNPSKLRINTYISQLLQYLLSRTQHLTSPLKTKHIFLNTHKKKPGKHLSLKSDFLTAVCTVCVNLWIDYFCFKPNLKQLNSLIMKRFAIMATLVALITFSGKAQQTDWSAIDIEISQLSESIFRLFVNNAVAVVISTGDDGLLMVDAAYEQSTDRLKEVISHLTNDSVTILINTHIHGDHTGGNKVFGKNARIIAHPAVARFLSVEQKRGETIIPAFPAHAIPGILVEDEMKLDFNGETIFIQHLPGGHTNSDLIVYFSESNVLVMGDLLFADYFPFIDVNNGGDPFRFLENVSRIMNKYPSDVTLVGGHGPVYTMEQLESWYRKLKTTIDHIGDAKSQGMSAEQMKSNRILMDWAEMGSFFITEDRWIDTIYPFL